MAGALAGGIIGHNIAFSAWISGSRDVELGGRIRENSASSALCGRKACCVTGHHVCSTVKATREMKVSRVVADKAIAEVYTDLKSRSPRSSSGVDESLLVVVNREDFSGAVESDEFVSVTDKEGEDRIVVQLSDQANSVSESGEDPVPKSWKDKLREDRKNHWWSDIDVGSSRLCMVEQIVDRLHATGGRVSNLSLLLAPFAGKVSLRVATLVFRRLPQTTAPLGVYKWLTEHQPDIDMNLPLYHALVQCLLRGRHWVGVESIVNEMSERECVPDGRLYRNIIKAASDAGNPKVANKWLQKMLARGLAPSLPTWNSVLGAFARDGNFQEVFFLHEQLKAQGVVENMITYCALLSACRTAGKVQEAGDILSEMKSRGMQPNRIIYSVLVDLYGKVCMPDFAAATFREMEKAGYQADQVAYNTLIHAFVKSGMIDDASKAFDRAINLGGHIDPVIFSTMINMYANVGLVERARVVLQTMEKYDFGSNHYQYAYTILINAYARVGQVMEAVRLFDEMRAVGHPIGDRIYTTMLNVYSKVGRLRCAEEMFQEMIRTGKCRNVVAFGTMMNIYGRNGRLEDAVRVFDSLKASGFRGNTVIYNTLIYCQGKNGNLYAVEEYVNEMKSAGLELDRVTYSSLIKAYNKSGRPYDAIRIYSEMRSAGVSLDKLVVGTMVNTFGRLKRYEDLVQLLDVARGERVQPDERLLRSVIDVYDNTQLDDCSPDTFSRFGELLIDMERTVDRQRTDDGRVSCIEDQDESCRGYQEEMGTSF